MRSLINLRRNRVVALIAGLSCLVADRSAWGVARTYTLVQNSSTIAISGTVDGSNITSQGTNNFGQNSLIARYSGTIVADRQSNTVNKISFLGGSAIDALVNGTWAPGVGGASGSAQADYGGRVVVSVPVFGSATVNLAGRGLVADLLPDGAPADIVNGQFDMSASDVELTAGTVDYRGTILGGGVTVLNDTYDLAGQGGSLEGMALISIQSLGGGMLRETLTIPIMVTLPPVDAGGYPVVLSMSGSLQATSDFADDFQRYWIKTTTDTFATAANWNPAITPVALDTAVFDLGSATNHTVNFGANATNNGLRIENDKVALALATRTYALTSTSTSVPSVIVGATSGDAGSLTLSGTGAGGTLNSVNASLGNGTSSTGAVTVGAGATWNNSSDLYVGKSGPGTLTISSGGKVVAPTGGGSYIGFAAGSTGSSASVTGTGSTWTNDYLFVGYDAAGTLTTGSGGLVTSKVASVGFHTTGGVTVGASSTFTNTDVLFVGEHATGTLTVSPGGTLNGLTTNIGANTGANGTLTVAGTGAQFNNTGSVFVGGIFSASGGTGALNINTNATVTIGGTLKTYANGDVNLSSGKLKVATMNLATNSFSQTGGQLVATTVIGNLSRGAGSLTPGDTGVAGQTSITGNYAQSGGTLSIELGGTTPATQYDRLSVSGTATLGGTLAVSLINGFNPMFGNTFQILSSVGRSGMFTTQNLPTLSNSSLEWIVNYGPTSGATALTLSVGLKGDYNGNGAVDAADYVVWRKSIGTPAAYNVWRTNFGATASGSGSGSSLDTTSASVPEPGTLALLAMAAVSMLGCSRRRRS